MKIKTTLFLSLLTAALLAGGVQAADNVKMPKLIMAPPAAETAAEPEFIMAAEKPVEEVVTRKHIGDFSFHGEEKAPETTAAVTEPEIKEIEPLVMEGYTQFQVTTSESSLPGVATGNFFDGKSLTGCKIAFIAVTEEEAAALPAGTPIATEKVFSIYTATRVPEDLRALAGLYDGEKGTLLAVSIYGTDDSLLLDWTRLEIQTPTEKIDEYYVIKIASPAKKYSFYRIDIKVENSDSFVLSELLLFKDAADDTYYYYESDGEVEAGSTPTLVAIPADAPRLDWPDNFIPIAAND